MTDSRSERLASDYREMLAIQNRPYLTWTAAKGEPPFAEEYLLTVKLRTYAMRTVQGRYTVGAVQSCTVRVTLWDSYPNTAPSIKMLSAPPVFHPSWYSKGTYCPSEPWRPGDSLKDHIKRMLGTLLFEPSMTEIDLPANYKALEWYMKNRDNSKLFPSDKAPLTENTPEEIDGLEKAALSFDEIIDSGI